MRPIHVVSAALVCAAGALAACNVVLGLDDLKDQVDSGAADTGTGDGGDADVTPNCPDYCARIANACTRPNRQYFTTGTCLAMCAKFPLGGDVNLKANTLACRWGNLEIAEAEPANVAAACASAGPYAPNCGGEAANFCALYASGCADDGGYGLDCPSVFGAIPNPPDAGEFAGNGIGGNTRACRESVLELFYAEGQGNGIAPNCVQASKDSIPQACGGL